MACPCPPSPTQTASWTWSPHHCTALVKSGWACGRPLRRKRFRPRNVLTMVRASCCLSIYTGFHYLSMEMDHCCTYDEWYHTCRCWTMWIFFFFMYLTLCVSLPGERIGLAADLTQSPPSIHVSKRLLFSIVHEKSGGRQTVLAITASGQGRAGLHFSGFYGVPSSVSNRARTG